MGPGAARVRAAAPPEGPAPRTHLLAEVGAVLGAALEEEAGELVDEDLQRGEDVRHEVLGLARAQLRDEHVEQLPRTRPGGEAACARKRVGPIRPIARTWSMSSLLTVDACSWSKKSCMKTATTSSTMRPSSVDRLARCCRARRVHAQEKDEKGVPSSSSSQKKRQRGETLATSSTSSSVTAGAAGAVTAAVAVAGRPPVTGTLAPSR